MSSSPKAQERRGVILVCTQMEAGGAQIVAMSMARYLVSNGYAATVVFLYRKRAVFDDELNVEVLFPRKPSPWDYIRIVGRLLVFVRKRRPQAIIGMAHYSSPLATVAGWITGVPRRIATQTSQPSRQNLFARGLDLVCGICGIYTANIPASTTIEHAFDRFPRAYRAKLRTIYNGVSVPSLSLTKMQARKEFGLDPDAFLVVTCGRLSAVKNQELLLDVVHRIPGIHLAILGEGELRSALEASIAAKKLQGRVTLLGEVPPDRVARFLRTGDVFAFPSHSEAFGMAAVEAMMSGLPIIASAYPAIAEVIGEAGPLIDSNDVDGWVTAVERYYKDPSQLSASAARSVRQGSLFTFEKMMKSYHAEFFGS